MEYTRYADDLTFSGPGIVVPALSEFIPLAERIIRDERFVSKREKRRVCRRSSRQSVTGVIVNEKRNICREDYDRLKATLHNCVQKGPASQKRNVEGDFTAHLQGRIAHVRQLNPQRAMKLQQIFDKINWAR